MSAPQTKRKVMGRIDISANGALSDASTTSMSRHLNSRSVSSSPVPGPHTTRKTKVNPSTIIGTGSETSIPAVNGRGPRIPFAQSNASFESHSPAVRSPVLKQGGAHGSAPLYSANDRGPYQAPTSTANSIVRAAHPLQTARSPSPSLVNAHLRAGISGESSSSTSIRAKARPASVLLSQRDGVQAARSITPISAKVATNADLSGRVHARSASSLHADDARAASLYALDQRDVSRSPSPTLVRAAPNRRVSYGSNLSVGNSSSVTSPQPISAAGRPSAVSDVSVKRPSLASIRAAGPSRGPSDNSVAGLESPLDLVSPFGREPSSTFANTSLTSPSPHTAALSSNPLLSPAAELDAEAVEAKTNRKILDLEITNRSLLAINSGLEVTKLRQAREIRDLKRRLREGRGLGDRLGLDHGEAVERALTSATEDEDESSEDEENEEAPLNAELEEAHQRCKRMIDGMVAQARHAILSTHEAERALAGNRVLHPAELDDEMGGADAEAQEDQEDGDAAESEDLTRSTADLSFDQDESDRGAHLET